MVLTGEEAFWKDSAIILKESQFVSFDENGKKNLIIRSKQWKEKCVKTHILGVYPSQGQAEHDIHDRI